MDSEPTPLPPIPWEQVLQQPWLIRAIGVLVLVGLVVQLIPRATGKYSATVEQWVNARRRTRATTTAADVTALSLQVDNMQTVLGETRAELAMSRAEFAAFRDETRRYQRAHDVALGDHGRWDRGMIQLVVSLGGVPLPLVPLYPDLPAHGMRDAPGDGDISDTRP